MSGRHSKLSYVVSGQPWYYSAVLLMSMQPWNWWPGDIPHDVRSERATLLLIGCFIGERATLPSGERNVPWYYSVVLLMSGDHKILVSGRHPHDILSDRATLILFSCFIDERATPPPWCTKWAGKPHIIQLFYRWAGDPAPGVRSKRATLILFICFINDTGDLDIDERAAPPWYMKWSGNPDIIQLFYWWACDPPPPRCRT